MSQEIFEDWKGNKIKGGDTIVLITTYIPELKYGVWMPGSGLSYDEKVDAQHVWVKGSDLYVNSVGHNGCYVSWDVDTFTFNVPVSSFIIGREDRVLVAIKGLSDQDPLQEVKDIINHS